MTTRCFFVLIALIALILKFYPLFRVNFKYLTQALISYNKVSIWGSPARPRSALFLLPSSRGCTPLTKHRLAGVADAASFRGHSFRRGAASWAFSHSVPGELIQLYGDWTSDAYKVYLELMFSRKLPLLISFVPPFSLLARSHSLRNLFFGRVRLVA